MVDVKYFVRIIVDLDEMHYMCVYQSQKRSCVNNGMFINILSTKLKLVNELSQFYLTIFNLFSELC